MPAGWINLIVILAIVVIVTAICAVFYYAATRKGGRPKPGLAKPSKAHYRKVNPKTGDLFR